MATDERASEQLAMRVRQLTGARAVHAGERVQSLWSGYGEIRRFELTGGAARSVVVKWVQPPRMPRHQRGWATQRSHERKLRSYDVEMAFYAHFVCGLSARCRVAHAHAAERFGDGWLFVLEDLDAAGFAGRRSRVSSGELTACLGWLARWHAHFMQSPTHGLWEQGCYWHLHTRPDELAAMDDTRLQAAAAELDRRLRDASHRTLVHGDAKLANFCFGEQSGFVAAVDFQYVGGGPGIRDVVYFFSSCLESHECEARAEGLLDVYFAALRDALRVAQPALDAGAVEAEWRALYPVAWADFIRFLKGWAPEHAKLHPYSQRLTDTALDALEAM